MSNNDIDVLNQSSLFNNILNDIAPECQFYVNGVIYTKRDYSEWATFVKTILFPLGDKRKKFKQYQEKCKIGCQTGIQ